MQKLIRGIHAFQSAIFSEERNLFERLAQGQTPETLFITCSDSRIDPCLITQTKPGDLFILRNAGNLIPAYQAPHGAESGTIEYAVDVLHVKDIVVCGHSHCGAMQGLLHPASIRHLPAVSGWLDHGAATARIVGACYPDLSGQELLTATIKENVLVQLSHLMTHPAVAAKLATGALHLHAWLYEFESGQVFAYDAQARHYRPLSPDVPPAVDQSRLLAGSRNGGQS